MKLTPQDWRWRKVEAILSLFNYTLKYKFLFQLIEFNVN